MKLKGLSKEIFMSRYAYPGDKDWRDRVKTVAKTIAASENDDKKELWEKKFYDILKDGDFIPGGRILYGAGRTLQNMLNCYEIDPDDNVDSIGKTISDMYKISCGGGGVGFDFSKIRPRGDDVARVSNSAPGSVSVMKMINEIGEHVRAGKNRRTALIAILRVDHPDILEFLTVKLDQGQLNNFNISVGITNRFYEAVENDEDWYFFFNNRKYHIYYVTGHNNKEENIDCLVPALNEEDAIARANAFLKKSWEDVYTHAEKHQFKARELWDKIYSNSIESGDPGIYNVDFANTYTNVSYFEELNATNPSLQGDTLVSTKDGIYSIKFLAESKSETYVTNYRGESHPCRVFKSGEDKQLYKIKFSNGSEVLCTKEHKWPLLKMNKNYKRDKKPAIDYGNFSKKATVDMGAGDLIYLPEDYRIGSDNSDLTKDEGFVIGWNYGDGWSGVHKRSGPYYGFIFSEEDMDSGIGDMVTTFINSKKKTPSSLRFNKGCYELYTSDKDIHQYFTVLGHYGKSNGIPDSVWVGSEDYILGFLDGLFSSDGYVDKKNLRIVLTSVHEQLVRDVQKLLLFMGIRSSLRFSTSKEGFSRWDLTITGSAAVKFAGRVTLTHERKNSLLLEYNSDRLREVNGRNYLRVVSVEPTDRFEDVYDITVYDDTHTFHMETGITGNCGEIPLPSYGNCCLGHVNLNNMLVFSGEGYEIDWKKLAKVARGAIRFLDNVLTVNHYPIPECREVAHRSRRIGMGVTGLHYFLLKLGYRYGDEKCCEFLERLFQTIRDEAYKASISISKEKGAFPEFHTKKYLSEEFAKTLPPRIRTDIKKYGIRNAVMLTIAPVGTGSMVLGVSTGVEPIFSPIYKRRYRDGNTWKEQIVTDPLFREWFDSGKDYSNFVGAYDVTPEEHIRVQASLQKYIDSAISKTCNLPENATYEELKDIIFDYAPYVKGFTIYRAGSKGQEPLEAISIKGMSEVEISSLINQSVSYGTDEEPEEEQVTMCDLTGKGCE